MGKAVYAEGAGWVFTQVFGSEKRDVWGKKRWGSGWGKRGWYLTLGEGGRDELENGGKYLTDGESKGSLGNFNCFES